ncbi:hypothetical protein LLS47_00860 [Rouxiella badensis]|jgi:hypothetical protein|uniref:Uncharacterized protein n=1 Tax=Rouxiella badensis TaxID=1646377 RepID=A0A1X0WFA9_9GAMM|nr:hypothetical protein [Rouxiella badensis]MCC3719970.1 hypothetical protein [Rouxiella badensis]MCC3729633.1 hypothetical protein [Rouxiella badensis]MCC3731484.1 hypothetical protein [Rouxiella badensis]MCC3738419.1 hypothetical protein [Rouxiella badensis]MCC3748890.1 hypothetical protein [Rouxiella badensis]
MLNIIYRLYDALGLEIDGDDPALVIDNDLTVYFNESGETLEMCCPVGALPTDVAILHRALQLNYASPVTLAADEENTLLLALMRFPEESAAAEVESGLHQLVAVTRKMRQHLLPAAY